MPKGPPTPNRVHLTLSDEAMEKLRELARANYRSVSGQVMFLISEAIEQDPRNEKSEDGVQS